MPRVAIVGAGVSGLSVGICLTDNHGTNPLDVTIISEKFSSQGITSDNAGGFVIPSDKNYTGVVNSQQTKNARRWTVAAYKWFNMLFASKADCGLEKKLFLMQHNLPLRLKTVWTFDCFLLNPAKYLQFLSRRFLDNGGQMIQRISMSCQMSMTSSLIVQD